jgi:hypothetical protein
MRYVRYIGPAHERQITARDWRGVGINGETVVWSAFNGFSVPLEQLTDDQVRKAIDPDQYFVITGDGDDEEEFVPTPQNRVMTPDQVEQVTKDPVDVVEYLNGGDDVSVSGSGAVPGGGGAAPTSTSTGKGAGSDAPGTTAH